MVLNCLLIVCKFPNGLAMISCCLWDQGDHTQLSRQKPARYTFRVYIKYFVVHQHKNIVREDVGRGEMLKCL